MRFRNPLPVRIVSSLRSDTIATGLRFLNRVDPWTRYLTIILNNCMSAYIRVSYVYLVCIQNTRVYSVHATGRHWIAYLSLSNLP